MFDLNEVGFKIQIITDGHPSYANAFSRLHNMFGDEKRHLLKKVIILLMSIKQKHFIF